MSLSSTFIERPVATTLLTIAIAIAGAIAFVVLPVSPLPQVDFPTIAVGAGLPGASAEIMASSIATPLERQFGHIAGVTEMTSASSLGTTSITLQFDLNRDIDGAARDVEAADQCRAQLPAREPPRKPDLSQGQPGRCADHDSRAHLKSIRSRQAVRRCFHRHRTKTFAGQRCRSGFGRGRRAALGSRRCQPDSAQQLWPHHAHGAISSRTAEFRSA